MDDQTIMRNALGRVGSVFTWFTILCAIFLLVPLAVVIPTSFTSGRFLAFPPEGLSLRWYGEIATQPLWTRPFMESVIVSTVATSLAVVMGTCAALGLHRITGRSSLFLRSLFILPIAMPYIVYALGLYDMFRPWRGSNNTSLMLGQGILGFPLVFVIVYVGLSALDPRLGRAAASLGAHWPTIVWRIELPLVKRNVLAGALFAYAFTFDEVVLALFLAPPDQVTFPMQMFRAAREAISPALSAASTVVVALSIGLIGLGALVTRKRVPQPAGRQDE